MRELRMTFAERKEQLAQAGAPVPPKLESFFFQEQFWLRRELLNVPQRLKPVPFTTLPQA